MITLFDRVIIPHVEGTGEREVLLLPKLQDQGIVEVVTPDPADVPIFCNYGSKEPGPLRVAGRLYALRKAVEYEPLIVNALMSGRPDAFESELAQKMHVSRRRLYYLLIDFLSAFLESDDERVMTNALSRTVPKEMQKLTRELTTELSSEDYWNVSELGVFIFVTAAVTAFFDYGLRLSQDLKAGVATKDFAGTNDGWQLGACLT